MKSNATKRKVFSDAIDLIDALDAPVPHTEKEVQMLPCDSIKPYHNHPFHLYEGERLQDMVESIKEHGILTPVIVHKTRSGYEMLSGHNRLNAAKMAGLTEVPAIVKLKLTEEEAYVYVIETNLMQRSFAELLPSEKAAVMAEHYDKMCCQGKRNDIIRELQIMSGKEPETLDKTCCHNGNKLKSLDVLADEYGYSSRNAARYLRLNHLIQPFKMMIDENKLALLAAVDLSYLSEEEQNLVCHTGDQKKLKPKMTAQLRKCGGKLTEEKIAEILDAAAVKKKIKADGISVKLPQDICEKYLDGMDPDAVQKVVEDALRKWFESAIEQ